MPCKGADPAPTDGWTLIDLGMLSRFHIYFSMRDGRDAESDRLHTGNSLQSQVINYAYRHAVNTQEGSSCDQINELGARVWTCSAASELVDSRTCKL